ncbi:D-alanyl-D-alanine endopeptidase [Thiomonas sp.]
MQSSFFRNLLHGSGFLLAFLFAVSLTMRPAFAAIGKETTKRPTVQKQVAKKLSTKKSPLQPTRLARPVKREKIKEKARPVRTLATKRGRAEKPAVAKTSRFGARPMVTKKRKDAVASRVVMSVRSKATVSGRLPAKRVAAERRRPQSRVVKTAFSTGAASSVLPAADELQVSPASTASNDDPLNLRSGSALVVDEGTDRVLLSKNADIARPIASLTKLMTAAVILDAHQPMDQILEITDADIDTLKWSSSRLRPGTRLTREELLKLALMSSENRAAHALARNYPGGMGAFIAAMNAKARSLGMNATRYVEPTGLSPQNESTAHDLALLVKAAYHYPLIREFSTHPESEVDVGARTLQYRNTDHLVFNRGWDILLQKTGYINEAGHCLVLQTRFEGRRVIVVLLDAWGRYSHFGDAQRIRTWLEAKGFGALHDPVARTGTLPSRGEEAAAPGLVRTAFVEKDSSAYRGE